MRIENFPHDQLQLQAEGRFANPRTKSGLEKEALRRLAFSIAIDGLLHPLLVTPEGLILGGQRRYLAIGMLLEDPDSLSDDDNEVVAAAAERFALEGVPCHVVDREGLDMHVAALTDNQRSELSTYELADAALRLSDKGASLAIIGRSIGKSKSRVSRLVAARRSAGPELLRAWRDGLPFETVKGIAELPIEQQPHEIAAETSTPPKRKRRKRGGYGRPGVEEVARRYEAARAAADAMSLPANTAEHAERHYVYGLCDALAFVLGKETQIAWFRKHTE